VFVQKRTIGVDASLAPTATRGGIEDDEDPPAGVGGQSGSISSKV
jgi:hypothetical protein